MVSQAGPALLRETVRKTGPDAAIPPGRVPWRTARAVHDPGKILPDAALAAAPGGDGLADGSTPQENLPHHVRDRTFREDDSKIHVGRLPRIMAGLRNLAIGVHRQDGHTNIAPPYATPPATAADL